MRTIEYRSHPGRFSTRPLKPQGFTLIELLVVIAIITMLAALLLPALRLAKQKAQGIYCMNNHKHLAVAWRMYTEDSNDVLVYASTSGSGNNWPDQYAWSGAHMDFNPSNPANWDPTVDMQQRPLWPYCGKTQGLFKCPGDRSTVLDSTGVARPRILSMSMNLYVGGFAPIVSVDTLPNGTDGHWGFAAPYMVYPKLSAITVPSKIFVFLDMREDRINWSNFMADMTGYSPPNPALYGFTSDLPGMYHNRGCGFSFADGHSELHRWLNSDTTPPLAPPGKTLPAHTSSPKNVDVAWLQDHSTRLKP